MSASYLVEALGFEPRFPVYKTGTLTGLCYASILVGKEGFEPSIFRVSGGCCNHLAIHQGGPFRISCWTYMTLSFRCVDWSLLQESNLHLLITSEEFCH